MKCTAWRLEYNENGKRIGCCLGTAECELCKCEGNMEKCDFYKNVRENANSKTTWNNWLHRFYNESGLENTYNFIEWLNTEMPHDILYQTFKNNYISV